MTTAVRRITAPFLGVGIERIPGLAVVYRRLYGALSPPGLHELRVNGLRMIADFDDVAITPSLWLAGGYEPTATRAFRSLVAPGCFVIDVGAHIGYYTLLAADLSRAGGAVLAFEPNPLANSVLRLNVLLNGFSNVQVSPLALSDLPGGADLHVQGGVTGAGSLERSCVSGPRRVHPVDVTTLDAAHLAHTDRTPALLKIDAQGFEGKILRGAATLLRSCRPAVVFEFNPRQLTMAGSRPPSVLRLLAELGYSLLLVDEQVRALRRLAGPAILAECTGERRDGGGFRNVVAAQPAHLRALETAGLVAPAGP